MFKIINSDTGEQLGIILLPTYIRKKAETGALITAKANNADGIAYHSTPYNLLGKVGVGAEETVVLEEFDEGEMLEELKDATDLIPMLEDALCEIDEANEERIAAIEDALCEMDMGGNE